MATTVENLFDKLNGSKWNAGVTFERTNPVPLEKYSVFHTLEDAQAYAAENPVAYPGQLLAVVTDTAVTTYKINVNGSLSQIDAAIDPGDLPISAGNGIEFGSHEGKTTINAKLKNGNGLTVDTDGYLSVQKIDFDTVIDGTTSDSGNAAYTSAIYKALTAIDNRVSSGYVPLSVTNDASATDKLQKASDVSAIASNYITELTAAEVTAAAGQAITSISQTKGKITAAAGKITVASADVTGLSGFVDNKVKAVDDKLSDYAQTSNLNSYIKLSSDLSTAWKYKLSAATAEDPVVLSSDISGLIAAGVTFGGVVATSADITAGKAGQVYVLTGTAGTTKEGIVTADSSTTGFIELGDEGAVANLATKIGALSTKVDNLSNSISAVKVGTATLTATDGQIELTNKTISTLFDASQLCTYTEISAQAKTDLSIAAYAKTADFTGKVGLLTPEEVRNAISGDISTALDLKALAHKDTVATDDIVDAAVTNAKLANASVTAEKLTGLFVLSCGDAETTDVSIS